MANPADDPYTAIALHLLAVLLRSNDPDRTIELLHQSIAMSSSIGLDENGVMARTSLVWALLSRGHLRAPETEPDLRDAFELARNSVDLARALGSPDLISGTQYAAAVAEWLSLSRDRSEAEAVPREDVARLVDVLDNLGHDAVERQDFNSAISTVSAAADIRVSVKDYDAALYQIRELLDEIDWMPDPPPRVVRLTHATRTALARSVHPTSRELARSLLDRIDELLSRVTPTETQEAAASFAAREEQVEAST